MVCDMTNTGELLEIQDIPSVHIPRYLNDSAYFLVGKLKEPVVFSCGPWSVSCPVGTEVFVNIDELESVGGYFLDVCLVKHFRFTKRIPRYFVSPA